jgi:uncharacterized protein (UPF0333 family)
MKLKVKDAALIIIAVVIVAVIVVFGFPSQGLTGNTVTATLTIDFVESQAPVYAGNLTTWTNVDGSWTISTVPNDGHSVWVFENMTSKSNCYDQLMAASAIGHFTMHVQNQTLGTFVDGIAGIQNQDPGAGWQYYINGVYANRACNLNAISIDDEIIWIYQLDPFVQGA